jgi:hypothetical protein
MKSDYEKRFCLLSARVEKVLLAMIAGAIVLLAAGQAAYQVEPIRHLLVETERWEGGLVPG